MQATARQRFRLYHRFVLCCCGDLRSLTKRIRHCPNPTPVGRRRWADEYQIAWLTQRRSSFITFIAVAAARFFFCFMHAAFRWRSIASSRRVTTFGIELARPTLFRAFFYGFHGLHCLSFTLTSLPFGIAHRSWVFDGRGEGFDPTL